jgi:uncharacterized membrane protein YkvA (DUF1232 family)
MTSLDPVGLKESESLDFYQKLRLKFRQSLGGSSRAASQPKNAYETLVGYLVLLPDLFHLAVRLFFDRTVPSANKGALLVVILYVMSPIDLIPDAIPVIGWVDDLLVLIIGLNKFLDTDDAQVAAAVRRHWAGDGDIFPVVKHLLSVADAALEFLPRQLFRKIKDLFK